MEEVATLVIRVQADQVDAAKAKLHGLGLQANQTETATGKLMGMWKGFAGLLAGSAAIGVAVAGLKKLVATAREFESLEAQLKTATGSAENAKVAFEALQDFARETPYDLAQTVSAFIKLTNLGLTPSERALRSYGNTASALGQNLEDMVRAVARSVAGEYEPLKSFGVQARKEADGIVFTFQGVSTKVKNTAKEIEGYFIQLGEAKFANAMSERMQTLEGKISNLGDAWDVLWATIGKAGGGDAMKRAIDIAISALEELTAEIASGQLQEYIGAIIHKFDAFGQAAITACNFASEAWDQLVATFGEEGQSLWKWLKDAFKWLPENVAAVVQGLGALAANAYESAIAAGEMAWDVMKANFELIVDAARIAGRKILDNLNPFDGETVNIYKELGDAITKASQKSGDALDRYSKQRENISSAFGEVVTQIMDERDASIASYEARIQKSKDLRTAYDEEIAKRREAAKGHDRLEGNRKGGTSATAEFETMMKGMRTQSDRLQQEYARRRQLIIDNTEAESTARKDALARNEEIYAQEKRDLLDRVGPDVEAQHNAQLDAFAIETEQLRVQYDEKQRMLDEALKSKLISEEEYTRRSGQLSQRLADQQNKIEREKQAYQLGIAADFFGNLSTVAGAFGKKGAKIAKAAAIVQATIKTYESATSAYASLSGIPYIGPALGAAAAAAAIAAGMANVAKIKSADYAGAYEYGGTIPAGKVGLVGETGKPELVKGPATVTSARTTADLLAGQRGGGVTVNVINQAGAEVETREREGSDGKVIDVIVKRAVKAVASDIREGTGPVSSAMATTFPLRRGAA